MDELYDHASFISAVPRIFVDKVYTLQNPTIANRVKTLTVWPSAIRDAINASTGDHEPSENHGRPSGHGHRRTHSNNILDRGRSYMDRFLDRKASPPPDSSSPSANALPSTEERTRLFTDAIRHLTHLDELQIVWYLDKDKQRDPTAWTFPHFSLIWRSVGYSLRRLSMDVQLHVLNEVTGSMSAGVLQQLEWLELTVRKDKFLSGTSLSGGLGGGAEDDSNNNAIPYVINKLAPTLQFLSIKTIGHQSLAFFDLLETFPRLRSLALVLPLDSYHLPRPEGLHRFLDDHRHNLQTLSVRYAQCSCRNGGAAAGMVDDGFSVGRKGHMVFSGLHFNALHSLEIGLSLPPSVSSSSSSSQANPTPSPFITSLTSLSSTLTSLTLVDRCLTLDEIRLILKAFPSNTIANHLKKLSLYVKKLSPQLVDLVATTCVGLSALTLDVERVVKRENVTGARDEEDNERESDIDGFVMALYDFGIQEDDYRYSRWTLSDITILTWEFKVGKRLNWTCMRAIAGVVPTVRRFAGKEEPESVSSYHSQSGGHGSHGISRMGRQDSLDSASVNSGRGSMDSTRSRSRNRQAVVYMRSGNADSFTNLSSMPGVRQELAPLRRRVDVASLPSRLDT